MEKIKTYFINEQKLPLVIEPTAPFTLEELLEDLKTDSAFLRAETLKYGGILLRGFPLEDIDAFSKVIQALNWGHFVDYIGGDSPRDKIKGSVYTSTEAPPSFKILLHNELSFVKNYPKHIYFYCSIPPQENGETIIGDARAIFHSMDPEVRNRFIEKGLKYRSCYFDKSRIMKLLNKYQRSHKSWHEVFETDDPAEVEEKCRKSEFDFRWHKGGWINVSQTRPAVMRHPETNEEVWFNQAHLYDFNRKHLGLLSYIGAKLFYFRPHTRLHEISFADGTPIPRKDLYHVMETLEAHTIKFPWQKNDALLLDNVLAMHGRAPFEGKRRIYTAMTT